MTREEIMTLGFEELETRADAIAVETAEADKDQLEELNAELDAIEERKKALNIEIEERKKAAAAPLMTDAVLLKMAGKVMAVRQQ